MDISSHIMVSDIQFVHKAFANNLLSSVGFKDNKITRECQCLFSAEHSKTEKRLFLWGRIAQYRGLGS